MYDTYPLSRFFFYSFDIENLAIFPQFFAQSSLLLTYITSSFFFLTIRMAHCNNPKNLEAHHLFNRTNNVQGLVHTCTICFYIPLHMCFIKVY